MNFPGLDFSWRTGHSLLHRAGAIAPWDLDRCQAELDAGCGVVVVATTALGDSLLCLPLVESLSAALGRDRVSFLVRDAYAGLYEGDPRCAHVWSVGGKYRKLGVLRTAMSEAGQTSGGRSAQSTQFTRLALIANCSEPDLIPWLWWCGVRGFLRYRTRWSEWPTWFANQDDLRQPGQDDYATGHAIDNNLAMAKALGLEAATHCLDLKLTEPSGSERRLLIHPGASIEPKRWPLERWAQVGATLAREFSCELAVTGGPGERALAEKLVRLLRVQAGEKLAVKNLAGQLKLRELAQAQRRARLFLSGDTGPYHLAVAAGCPTVTLFAPVDRGSSTEACGPHQADPQRHRALQTECLGLPISSIPSDAVLSAARTVLQKTSG